MKRFFKILTFAFILIAVSVPVTLTQAITNQDVNSAIGVWSCWDDGTIDPCHNSLNSVSLISITNGWAVGENGTILRWNGSVWTKVTSPTSSTLNSVQMNTTNDGWMVGNGGIIFHWDGSTWSPVYSPTSNDLKSLSIVSTTNVWTVGWDIFHWDGSSWSKISSPNNHSIAIAMVPDTNGTDGWAVGYSGSILRWNGSQWLEFTSPTSEYLYDIVMISASDGWIVGNKGTFLHWDGNIWSLVSVPPVSPIASIWEIDAASSSDIWAIGFDNGFNNIYHWNGTNWGLIYGNAEKVDYSGISVTPNTSGTDAWVVGGSGNILRWNGIDWTPVNEPYTKSLYDIKMLSSTDGWSVGTGWPVAIGDAFHWNGANWNPIESMDAYSVDFFSDTNGTMGWAVGVWGDIYRWDGSNWYSVSSPSTVDLWSVDIISSEDAWAVGGGVEPPTYQTRGVIIHLENSEWVTVTMPTTTTVMSDVSMISPTIGWAVGETGTIFEWQGSGWLISPSPTTQDLASIQMLDASNGWIVGGNGTILHWDGMLWSSYASPTTSYLTDIAFISPTDGWAVGVGGTILRWDGINWTQVDSPVTQSIYAIAYSTPYELWAVGRNGLILHYEFNPNLSINYSTGAPSSFFTLTGTNFPPDSLADLTINGHSLGAITSDSSGSLNFILSTSQAEEGIYNVTVSVNPSASVKFVLDNDSPIRLQEGSFTIFDIPAGIAYTHVVNLPLISK